MSPHDDPPHDDPPTAAPPGPGGPTDDGRGRTGPAAVAEEEYVELTPDAWRDADPPTSPSGSTLEADRAEAAAEHGAGPIDEDAADAAPPGPVDPAVAATAAAANRRGAAVKGEGQIVPDAGGS